MPQRVCAVIGVGPGLGIAPDTPFAPERIAEAYWRLSQQERPAQESELVFDGRWN